MITSSLTSSKDFVFISKLTQNLSKGERYDFILFSSKGNQI